MSISRKTLVGLAVLLIIAAGIIWLLKGKTEQAVAPLLSVQAYNQTKNVSATDIQASAEDIILYTLTAQNQSDQVIPGYIVQVNISEITDKATLLDAFGASYDAAINSLVWTPLDIPAQQSITQKFSVKINPLPQGQASAVLKLTFNNELNITVTAPTVAGADTGQPDANQNSVYKSPVTGSSEMLPVVFAILMTVSVLIVRKYSKKTEVLGITKS